MPSDDNIVWLPRGGALEWAKIERAFRETFVSRLSSDAVESILADLRPRMLGIDAQMQFSVQAPPECEPAINAMKEQVTAWLHGYSTQMIGALFALAIELYYAKRNG